MVRLPHLATLALIILASPLARANVSFTGTFNYDTDLQYFTFTLLNPTPNVALRTWSYSGGTNAAGQVIAGGGFEPYLNLYLSDGSQMNPGFSGPCTVPTTGNVLSDLLPDPSTGECADVYYPTTLSFPGGLWSPGTYTLVLSTWANPGIGNLSDGFFAEQVLGLPVPSNFSCEFGPNVNDPFCDAFLITTERTGNWALDFINVDSAAALGVPEPSTLLLVALGGLFVAAKRLRFRT
jgi:hypothetical protein